MIKAFLRVVFCFVTLAVTSLPAFSGEMEFSEGIPEAPLIVSKKEEPERYVLDFVDIRLRDLVRIVYGQVLKRSYVMDSVAVDDGKLVSFVVTGFPEEIDIEIQRLLETQGLMVDDSSGVVTVGKKVNFANADMYVYHPKHRSVAYLLDLAIMLFPQGSFSTRRQSLIGANSGWTSGMTPGGITGLNSGVPATPQPVTSLRTGAVQQDDVDVIVFRGRASDIRRLKTLFKQVDIELSQVLVKVALYEVQKTKGESSAVDLAVSLLSGKFGLNFVGGAVDRVGAITAKLAGKLNFTSVYSALSKDERFKMVSSPRVRVRSGAQARFSVGSEVPILGSVSYDNMGRPIQSVTYRPSGVIFDVAPKVRQDAIDIRLNQQISSFVETTTGVNGSPTLIKRELLTDITVRGDEMIIIGGLEEQKNTESSSGLSFLPAFFRTKSDDESQTEIVLLLQAERI
jgi:type II secretory pathway component GspD/PulD (secretin)